MGQRMKEQFIGQLTKEQFICPGVDSCIGTADRRTVDGTADGRTVPLA